VLRWSGVCVSGELWRHGGDDGGHAAPPAQATRQVRCTFLHVFEMHKIDCTMITNHNKGGSSLHDVGYTNSSHTIRGEHDEKGKDE
jgi:hypothetical protein